MHVFFSLDPLLPKLADLLKRDFPVRIGDLDALEAGVCMQREEAEDLPGDVVATLKMQVPQALQTLRDHPHPDVCLSVSPERQEKKKGRKKIMRERRKRRTKRKNERREQNGYRQKTERLGVEQERP